MLCFMGNGVRRARGHRLVDEFRWAQDELFRHASRALPGSYAFTRVKYSGSSAPLEWAEVEGVYSLEVDLPGVSRDDLSVVVRDGTVEVRGRRGGRDVEASLGLPDDADAATVRARLADGVLHLTVGRRPDPAAAGVTVKVE